MSYQICVACGNTKCKCDKPPADSKPRECSVELTCDGGIFNCQKHDLQEAYAQLERERDDLLKQRNASWPGGPIISYLERERDKYRAALEEIAKLTPENGCVEQAADYAREALKSQDLPPFTVAGNPSESEIAGERKD